MTVCLLSSIFIVEVAEEEPDSITVDKDHLLDNWVGVRQFDIADNSLLHFGTSFEG